MIQVGLDYTLFFQIIQFILIVFISNKLILKPIKTLIDTRDNNIKIINDSALELLATLEKEHLNYEVRFSKALSELAVYNEELRNKASKEVENLILATRKKLTKLNDAHLKELDKMIKVTKNELRKDIPDLTKIIYEQVSGAA